MNIKIFIYKDTRETTTNTMSIQPQSTSLIDKWNLYYHSPYNKNWDDISGYIKIMENIDSIEKLIALNETIPENIIKHGMLFVMRSHITPMWEDPCNRSGGCFSYKVINKHVYAIWKTLFYSICGETLAIDKKHNSLINGITISPKKNFCIIKVWMKDCSLQDPSSFIQIPNLVRQGCLFKEHKPEF